MWLDTPAVVVLHLPPLACERRRLSNNCSYPSLVAQTTPFTTMSKGLEPPQPHRFSQIPLSPPVAPPFGQYLTSPGVPHQEFHEKARTATPSLSPAGSQRLLPYIGLTSRLSLTLLTLPLLSLLLSV